MRCFFQSYYWRGRAMNQPRNSNPNLESIFNLPIGRLLEMDEPEIRQLLAKAEFLCRWLRGALRLKNKKGNK
jgi:hypothetical protein